MKLLIALLFLIAASTIVAQSTGYVRLSNRTIRESDLIQDLRQIGAEYVLQQGIFKSTNAPLPNGSWNISQTESVYRKVNNSIAYYNFTVQLKSISANQTIRARYAVYFNQNTGNTLVTSYSYRTLRGNGNGIISDLPEFVNASLLDDNTTNLRSFLDQGVAYTVNDAIDEGDLPDSDYNVTRIFSIQNTGFSYPYGYKFLVKLLNGEGNNYNVRITVFDTENVPEEDASDFDPEYDILSR